MAFSGRGFRSDINVAPVVGVVIVVLVTFLLATPVLMREIDVAVSGTDHDDCVCVPDHVTVELTESGAVMLNGVAINRTDLATKLRARLDHKRERVVYVDPAPSTRYGDAVQIMD